MITISETSNVITISTVGAQGAEGPDPWLDPVQVLDGNGPITIDYSAGKHVRLRLLGDTTISISNWPANNRIARLTIEIENTADFEVTWPTAVWAGGSSPPAVTSNGTDIYILATTTAGTKVFGLIVGQDFL
jgi:hypothetical protein